jgi:hypothetical protein
LSERLYCFCHPEEEAAAADDEGSIDAEIHFSSLKILIDEICFSYKIDPSRGAQDDKLGYHLFALLTSWAKR